MIFITMSIYILIMCVFGFSPLLSVGQSVRVKTSWATLESTFLVAEQLYKQRRVSVRPYVCPYVRRQNFKLSKAPQLINNYYNNNTYNNNNNSQISLGNIWPVCMCTHVQI